MSDKDSLESRVEKLEALVMALARNQVGWRTEDERKPMLEGQGLLWRHVRSANLQAELDNLKERKP